MNVNITKEDANFLPVDIHDFRKATRDIGFDLYLKVSEDNYAHIFSRSTGIDYKRLAQYIEKGVEKLYVRKEDEALYRAFVSTTPESLLKDPGVPEGKKVATLVNMTEQNMAEIFARLKVPEETAENAKAVIKSYVDLMTERPRTLSVLLKLASHGEYLYYHSIAVAIFSMFIAKATGQMNRRMTETVALGGFLHDIGQTQLPESLANSSKALTPGEWKQMRTHPKLGLKMIENTPSIPDEVRYIVYQHHEEPSGNGYPNGLRGDAIFYPAKIVAVADGFSALISHRPFRPPYSVEQAIKILESEVGKYDPDLVGLVATIFGGIEEKDDDSDSIPKGHAA